MTLDPKVTLVIRTWLNLIIGINVVIIWHFYWFIRTILVPHWNTYTTSNFNDIQKQELSTQVWLDCRFSLVQTRLKLHIALYLHTRPLNIWLNVPWQVTLWPKLFAPMIKFLIELWLIFDHSFFRIGRLHLNWLPNTDKPFKHNPQIFNSIEVGDLESPVLSNKKQVLMCLVLMEPSCVHELIV